MRNNIHITLTILLLAGCNTNDPNSDIDNPARQTYAGQCVPNSDFEKALQANKNITVSEISPYFSDPKSINERDADSGFTPLITAALANNTAVVKYLLETGAHPDEVAQNPNCVGAGYPALLPAVAHMNVQMVHDLLAAGANPRQGPADDTFPIFHRAIVFNIIDSQIVEEFLKTDRNLANWEMPYGVTPLHSAAGVQDIDKIQLLLSYGANKETKNRDGKTAWDLANSETKKAIPNLKP